MQLRLNNGLGGLMLGLALLASSSAFAAETKKQEAKKVAEPAATAPAAAPVAVSPVENKVNTVCAACHSADGNSVISLNPKLAGQHASYLEKQLTEFKSGKRVNAVMAGMAAGLSDAEIKELAQYFSSKSLKLSGAVKNVKGSLGEKIYRAGVAGTGVPACAGCHGANGAGLPKQFPALRAQHADYTTAQLKAFRSGERANAPMMQTIAVKMTDAEVTAVADYIQGLR